jgi:hypothetical protein
VQIREKRGCSVPTFIKAKVSKNFTAIFASREFGISSAVWDLKQMSEIPNTTNQLYI